MEQAGKRGTFFATLAAILRNLQTTTKTLVLGAMSEKAQIILDGKTYEFPIVIG